LNETTSPKPWSPRAGWKFFFLWMLGEVAASLVQRFFPIWSAPSVGVAIVDWNRWAAQTALALPVTVWTGYLLFRPGLRLLLWVVLPIALGAAFWAWINTAGLSMLLYYPLWLMTTAATPAMQALLMLGVRRRVWAWLIACVAAQLFHRHSIALVSDLLSNQLPGWLAGLPPFLGAPQIAMAVWSGLWLLGAAGCAYVLAFWMPPITRENRTAAPPLPDPIDA
jgi:hypothetical protein